MLTLISLLQTVNDLLQTSSCTSRENSFEERFKYDVISSSLLSSSLAAPASAIHRTFAFAPEFPGKLDDGGGGTEDGTSPSDSKAHDRSLDSTSGDLNLSGHGQELPIALLSIAIFFLSAGSYVFAAVFLAAGFYARHVVQADQNTHSSTAQTLHELNELISSGNVWDSAVNEAIMLIENEERSIFYGPTSQQAPSSALRMALQSSLHTTQTQCDNVRQLLSALTDPASLSQLTEMYAPSSPIRPSSSLSDNSRSPLSASSTMRPFSHPSASSSRQRTISLPNSKVDKRATWNGSYAALAGAGSPTAHLLNRKKRNRRSHVTSLFQPLGPEATYTTQSAPVSPQPPSPEDSSGRLMDVVEEEHEGDELAGKGYFGAAALDLQRKRRSVAQETFGVPPPSYTPSKSPSRGSRPLSLLSPTISSSSRLTSVHTTRHPLSLSGLHLALQGALSAKRYACSHLLALRFSEDEDDSYWEDVRSIMSLLSSTFSDASARLIDALNEAEKRRVKDEHPTPPRGNTPTPNDKELGHTKGHERKVSPLRHELNARSLLELTTFAPMPSSMARLASHIETISSALDDARDHIHECVKALRDPLAHRGPVDASNVQEHPAFQAYDRLRKELGFALRECERGRERLLDILVPPSLALAEADDEEASPNTPGLKHDWESETSEKGPASPNAQGADSDSGLGLTLSYGREDNEHEHDLDDATAHLLLSASSQHLPPPGVDQVFEAESGNVGAFARPRSKLSREERIQLMKAKRSSGRLLSTSSSSLASPDLELPMERPGRERWGPGGEVVQELKDVIWKVGERKRKMSQRVQWESEFEGERGLEERREIGDGKQETGKEDRTTLPPIPVPERETSVSIEVIEESPVAEVEESAYESQPEATDFVNESELAYLDSPSPAFSQPLPPSHMESYFVLESGSTMDDTQRTVSHSASVPSPVLTPALVLEADGAPDAS
ncbi:hypothetical protein BD311DRAFT_671865 [Dichomitus squalens]|uniref:Uncharacterized protein n=1 Tax=Dichomitus squalens TaxID=114155 RepID=A0A4Q9MAY0_9APHY|nr:hypothetical protein BD311DRAFT_671865 [Dichomitus squalens]